MTLPIKWLLATCVLLISGAAWSACGPLGATIGGNGLNQSSGLVDLGNGSTINGTAISGSGNVLQPSGGLTTQSISLPDIDPAVFPTVAGSDTAATSLPAGAYGEVTVNGTTTFSTVGGTYYITTLKSGGSNKTAVLAPGFYFIDNLDLGNGFTITVSPAGPVRIYVNTQFKAGNDYRFNAGGEVANFQVFLYPGANFDIGNKSNADDNNDFTGLIYAPGTASEIKFGNKADFRGNITTGGTIDLGGNTDITSTSADQAAVAGISTCVVPMPVADWRFDECTWNGTAGEVIDSSGNAGHGRAVGTSSTPAARIGRAADLTANGTGDYIAYPRTPLQGRTDLSISLWFKTAVSKAQQELLQGLRSGATDDEVELYLVNNNKVRVNIRRSASTAEREYTATSTFNNNAWHHLVLVRAGGAATVFLDGVSLGAQSFATGALNIDANSLVSGQEMDCSAGCFNSGQNFQGALDEVKVFSSALAGYQVAALYANEGAGKNYDGSTRSASACGGADHYAISYPVAPGSNGLTCQPTTVRVTAHDAAHSPVMPAAGTVLTLATSPAATGWALKSGGGALLGSPFRYVYSGSESAVDLFLIQNTPTSAPHIDIDLVDAAGKRDRDGDASEDVPAAFFDAGLVFDVPDHPAGMTQTVAVRAVRKDETTQACVPALQSVTRDVGFWFSRDNPATGGLSLNVNGTAVAGVAPGTTRSLSFDNAGAASIDVMYADVGALTLNASVTYTDAAAASRTLVGADTFTVRPYGFKLTDLSCAASFSPAADAFCPAGETVSGTLTAVRYDAGQPGDLGAVTPNFGKESTAQTATLAVDGVVLPSPASGGTATALANVVVGAFGETVAGAASIAFNWPQVGRMTVRPHLPGGGYLGSGDLTTGGADASRDFAGAIGRFYPYRFLIADNGSSPGFAACGLTYAGQPFQLGFVLTAVSKNLAETTNYGVGAYAPRLTGAALSIVAENADAGVNHGALVVNSPAETAPSLPPTWTSGRAIFAANNYSFRRHSGVTGVYGPWNTLRIGVRVADNSGDAVPLAGDMNASTTGACLPNSCDAYAVLATPLRFGRLRMSNAYGSELTQLPVPLIAEYWTGSGWVQHTGDNCTALTTPPASSSFSDYRRGLSAGETAATLSSPLVAGSARLRLSAPGSGNAGAARLTIPVPTWLKYRWDGVDQPAAAPDGNEFDDDPSAVANFGVYRNNFIFMRENY